MEQPLAEGADSYFSGASCWVTNPKEEIKDVMNSDHVPGSMLSTATCSLAYSIPLSAESKIVLSLTDKKTEFGTGLSSD